MFLCFIYQQLVQTLPWSVTAASNPFTLLKHWISLKSLADVNPKSPTEAESAQFVMVSSCFLLLIETVSNTAVQLSHGKITLQEECCRLPDHHGNPQDLGHQLDQSLPVWNENGYQDLLLCPGAGHQHTTRWSHMTRCHEGRFTLSPGGPAGPGGPMGPTLP